MDQLAEDFYTPGPLPTGRLRMYDVSTDNMREVTQKDVDIMQQYLQIHAAMIATVAKAVDDYRAQSLAVRAKFYGPPSPSRPFDE